ncbi:response regulator transcription factor [Variovorax defluvii]|uniref:Response regulator transcription factor n=1 Tax=Variovorax defluvii TaxID=913761 RepID=A0ABP8I2B7_9BURK
MRIAVLDDDPTQMGFLVHALKRGLDTGDETVTCVPFEKGEALRKSLRQETFDLLVLDWNVPDLDGVELLHWLRSFQKSDVPVIMLSSRSAERDVAGALGIGADDYVVKPFRTMELCARIRRLLARKPMLAAAAEQERFGKWRFDQANLCVHLKGNDGVVTRIPLTDREFRLALALFRHMGHPVSRAYLLEKLGVHGMEMPSRALDSHIYRLRSKLGLHSASGLRLQTVYGRGYRLERLIEGENEDEGTSMPDSAASGMADNEDG